MSSPNANQKLDVLRARALLMIGGLFGVHRLYLKQVPEAFIFFSTAGVFLIGVFYDSFYIHGQVDQYNEHFEEGIEKPKIKRSLLRQTTSQITPFSISRVLYSILYGVWLGVLTWVAGSVTFGRSHSDCLVMISAMAAAVTAGVFIVGNSACQQRDLMPIWLASFSILFLMTKVFDSGALRALLLAALTATLLGNRTAKMRSVKDNPFNHKHFVFWCSLFALLMCVIAVGASKHILERRVTSTTEKKGITSSVAKLVYDRWTQPEKVWKFFDNEPQITFENTYSRKARKESKSFFWWLDMDGWAGGKAPMWTDHAAVFAVDLLRGETRARRGLLTEEPLKWAAWRTFTLVNFGLTPTASDHDLSRACARWRREKGEKVDDVRGRSTVRGCEVALL